MLSRHHLLSVDGSPICSGAGGGGGVAVPQREEKFLLFFSWDSTAARNKGCVRWNTQVWMMEKKKNQNKNKKKNRNVPSEEPESNFAG